MPYDYEDPRTSPLTQKLVAEIRMGRLDPAEVFSRLTDEERPAFMADLARDREEGLRNLGLGQKVGAVAGAGALGAGMALGVPVALGGATAAELTSLLPSMGAGVAPELAHAAKWGALIYGASKLPEPLRTPIEMLLMMKGMKSGPGGAAGGAAGAGAGAATTAAEEAAMTKEGYLDPRKMGGMTDQEVIDAFKRQGAKMGNPVQPSVVKPPPAGNFGRTESEYPPNLRRYTSATQSRAPRKPGMIGNYPEEGGGPITYHNEPTPAPKPTGGATSKPNKPAGSGRSFTESPSERASREALERNAATPGSSLSSTKGNGTFKNEVSPSPVKGGGGPRNSGSRGETRRPSSSTLNDRNPELPPGYSKGMSEEDYNRLFDRYVNQREDKTAVERMRQRIAKGLDKGKTPTPVRTRSPK